MVHNAIAKYNIQVMMAFDLHFIIMEVTKQEIITSSYTYSIY
jgi:hypothetical protein